MRYYIYFIKSLKNERVYVGKTTKNPKLRLEEHNHGKNIWSRHNGPFKLIYFEEFYCLKDQLVR